MKAICVGACWMVGAIFALITTQPAVSQAQVSQAQPFPPTVTVKQLMLDLIHPSSNDILLAIYRNGPKDPAGWATVRRAAVSLAESGNMLMLRGRARDQADWMKDAKLLVDAGNAAYKAALAKDGKALTAVGPALDASCTACHKQYRPNVFPPNALLRDPNGGAK